jgi:hypothetical protein
VEISRSTTLANQCINCKRNFNVFAQKKRDARVGSERRVKKSSAESN